MCYLRNGVLYCIVLYNTVNKIQYNTSSADNTGVGDISPLRKVICFARTRNVRAMRELLFEYGAVESKEDKERWDLREYTDMNEKAWLRNFHRDDR